MPPRAARVVCRGAMPVGPALLVCACLCVAARAQDPPPREPPPKRQDESDAAAEALRRLLGLKPGPAQDTEQAMRAGARQGPPVPPDFRYAAPPEPVGPPLPRGEVPLPVPEEPQERPERATDAERAADALRRIMPDAEKVTELPDRTGTAPPERDVAGNPGRAVAPEDAGRFRVRGSLTTRYRLRAVGSETDQEATALLSASVGEAGRDPFSLHFVGRGYADLDGSDSHRLRGIEDTFGDAVTGRLYQAHLDVHALPGLAIARAGRQTVDETPVFLHFDGARVETRPFGEAQVWGGAFVGLPVHLFESLRSGDLVAGFSAGAVPWPDGRVRLDWLHLEDRLRTGTRQDDLLGLAWWQTLGGGSTLHLAHTRLGSEARDLTARLRVDLETLGTRARVSWYQLLETQRALVTELDPFFEALLEYEPYWQLGVAVDQDLGSWFGLTGAVDVRRLRESTGDRPFNREFERYAFGPSVRGLFGGRLGGSVTAELWHTDGERIETIAAEAQWQFGEATTLGAGTSFLRYKFDPRSGEEREHVRTYALRLTHRTGALRFDLRYEIEDADLADFQTFTAGMTWTF